MGYAPHVKIPILLLNGEFDSTIHYREHQLPFLSVWAPRAYQAPGRVIVFLSGARVAPCLFTSAQEKCHAIEASFGIGLSHHLAVPPFRAALPVAQKGFFVRTAAQRE